MNQNVRAVPNAKAYLRQVMIGATLLTTVTASCLAQPAPARPVRIGVLSAVSTQGSAAGGLGALEAARLAVADFGGTVLGGPIELIQADMQDKPDLGSAIAREWYDRGGVDVIVDAPNSAVALAVLEVARQRNKILITSGAGATDFSGRLCAPTAFQWAFDSYSLSAGTARALTKAGARSWFFIVSDFAFGHSLERDASEVVKAAGGQVVGAVAHPTLTADLASPLLQAQQAHPNVIGLAEGPPDNINAVKQAAEFGITQSGTKLAAFYMTIADVHAMGLDAGQGLILTDPWYWDANEQTRAFAKRFWDSRRAMPSFQQAGTYSSVFQYLKAVQAAGTTDGPAVAAKLHELPVTDMFTMNGVVRADGLMAHDMLLVQVKSPSASTAPWDYYTVLQTLPAAELARPLSESACPLVRKP